MSEKKKNIIKTVAFIAIFILLFTIFCQVFHFKYGKALEQFYSLPKNSVDVLIVGSSHAYRNIDPDVLYEKSGTTGYIISSASQQIWNSYYYIKEALKTQKPKVVVVECFKAYVQDDYADYATAIKSASGMRLSMNYFENLNASVEDKDHLLEYYLMFPWYHSRYAELTEADIAPYYGNPYYKNFLGYFPIYEPAEGEFPERIKKIKKRKPLTEKVTEYLERMVELSEEEGFELVFVLTPFWSNARKMQPYYNSLADFSEEHDVPLIQGNYLFEQLEFDETTDFGKGNHLSHSGAKKFTMYLDKWLKENFDLPDHREDPYYQRWEENRRYMEEVEDLKDLEDPLADAE